MKRLPVLLLLPLILCACTAAKPVYIPQTPGSPPISECFLHREAFVWIDEDGDGLYDEDERPFFNVTVTIFPMADPEQAFYAQTASDGHADINGIGDFGRYCDELEAEVSVPPGYTPSTPPVIDLRGLPPADTLQFGLMPLPRTATPE